MEYICRNPECSEYGKRDYYAKESYVFRNKNMIGKNAPCPRCGKIREKIDSNEKIPLSEKNISINFFNGMSMEQKREMLKKRSHDHFEKHIREKKEETLQRARREMSEYRKR